MLTLVYFQCLVPFYWFEECECFGLFVCFFIEMNNFALYLWIEVQLSLTINDKIVEPNLAGRTEVYFGSFSYSIIWDHMQKLVWSSGFHISERACQTYFCFSSAVWVYTFNLGCCFEGMFSMWIIRGRLDTFNVPYLLVFLYVLFIRDPLNVMQTPIQNHAPKLAFVFLKVVFSIFF